MNTLKNILYNSVACFYATCILYLVSLLVFSLAIPAINEVTAPILRGVMFHQLLLFGISISLLAGITLTIIDKLLTKK